MLARKNFVTWLGIIVGVSFVLSGCVSSMDFSGSLQKTQEEYEKEGNDWGKRVKQFNDEHKIGPATNLTNNYKKNVCEYVTQKDIEKVSAEEYFKANNITKENLHLGLVRDLFTRIDYFNVHSDLKDSFKKGFRLGYQDRTADLVLGPHLVTTAACIGMSTSQEIVVVIKDFEVGWGDTLDKASKTFEMLISEGSQADRTDFVKQFTDIYRAKYEKTDKFKKDGMVRRIASGGTALYKKASQDATEVVTDIPSPDELKDVLYTETFIVMGDSWGRRYENNLIKRYELVDLLRRVKPVLSETNEIGPGKDRENLARLYDAFNEAYTADKEAFRSMIRDAGIDVALLQAPSVSSGVKKK